MSRTQTQRVLDRLRLGSLCSMEPLDWAPRITRLGARIYDLKAEGYEIETRSKCYHHTEAQHHALYELIDQDQGALF